MWLLHTRLRPGATHSPHFLSFFPHFSLSSSFPSPLSSHYIIIVSSLWLCRIDEYTHCKPYNFISHVPSKVLLSSGWLNSDTAPLKNAWWRDTSAPCGERVQRQAEKVNNTAWAGLYLCVEWTVVTVQFCGALELNDKWMGLQYSSLQSVDMKDCQRQLSQQSN